jgi:hypothetical protein
MERRKDKRKDNKERERMFATSAAVRVTIP